MSRPGTSSVMFHTVGVPDRRWAWNFLTVPWQLFDAQLGALRRFGYRAVFLREYMDIALAGRLEQERVVSLTFDDGYLDNWVFAAPLLKKHGFCGTIFVSTDFVDPAVKPRPQFDPTRPESARLPSAGFLSWSEMRALEQSGVMEIQSHGITHTWYPSGPKIVDFRHPGDTYYWMDWNACPEDKWGYLKLKSDPGVWGEPVYEHAKSMDGPVFRPDERVGRALREVVASMGRSFFDGPDWRRDLHGMADEMMKAWKQTSVETHDEFMLRVHGELADSKAVLEDNLHKKIDFFCWPGGGYTEEVFDAASGYYVGTTVGSRERLRPAALDENGCFRFSRVGPPGVEGRIGFRYLGPWLLPLFLEEVRGGSRLARLFRGGGKLTVENWEKMKIAMLGRVRDESCHE
ncbi:peptidoglycan/xylan/chitin deacetylase (PgdA/CDA1 family) [Desulfomicrobium macestii]|uniref:Polysaccharide deacetylase n=2 Tax=Desulfomicrobium TaxID=898 RepID=A0A8G2FCP5_DESNO|nr:MULTISPECIES: polysaccharide deacetylase family protein [Desulfomicrobium]MBE1424214.1 peptidoglycan/xylan/chitin deacetylase (PgdA/CDA1 family) [Desulfomicrobium macestii]SFL28248.1 Polysaccharide deacetylase [Desulfomicrobium norvegicum]